MKLRISNIGESAMIVIPRKVMIMKDLQPDDWVEVKIVKTKKFITTCEKCGKTVTGHRVYKPKKCPYCNEKIKNQ